MTKEILHTRAWLIKNGWEQTQDEIWTNDLFNGVTIQTIPFVRSAGFLDLIDSNIHFPNASKLKEIMIFFDVMDEEGNPIPISDDF